MSSACRVCLAGGNTTLHSLKNNQLVEVYEKLSNTQFNSKDARPRALCHLCYRKLLRCHTFSQMAHRSEKIFNHLYDKGLEATQEHINQVNREMKQHLSVATMQFVTNDDNAANASSQVNVKDEPIPSFDMKEEVTTEQEIWVEIESVPEDCTKCKIKEEFIDRGNDVEELKSIERTNSQSQLKEKQFSSTELNAKKTSMIEEKMINNQKKQFACNVCFKQFNHKGHLATHMRIHTGEKPFVCNVCDKHFNQNSSLVSHMRIHTGVKPFACNVCDKRFIHNGHLVTHMRTHTAEKPFACNVCNKQFSNTSNLSKHIRIHTGEKPYACNVCDKRFDRNSDLVRHVRIHTGEKPFVCNVCDKQFNQKGDLKKHVRIHTGKKPLNCNVCDKQFVHRNALVRHMTMHIN